MRNLCLEVRCLQCKQTYQVLVDREDFKAWRGGKLIQRAMPYLTSDERELLISAVCGTCFDALFPPEEEPA